MVPALRSLSSHLSSSSLSVSLPSYIFHLTFPTDSFSLASRQAHFHLVLKHFLYYFSRTALPYLDSLLSLQTAESIVCLHLYLRCCLVTKSCLNLCDPMDSSLQGSSVHGISQARILERVAISFSRGSSPPRSPQKGQTPSPRFSQAGLSRNTPTNSHMFSFRLEKNVVTPERTLPPK